MELIRSSFTSSVRSSTKEVTIAEGGRGRGGGGGGGGGEGEGDAMTSRTSADCDAVTSLVVDAKLRPLNKLSSKGSPGGWKTNPWIEDDGVKPGCCCCCCCDGDNKTGATLARSP
jgi:hypothetical protein